MRTMLKAGLAAVALAAALAGGTAHAQKSADTLRIVFRDGVPNVDPYYNNLRTGVVLHHQAWDTLVYRDPETFELKPLLATEWQFTDPTTIDMKLRAGVKFHDGSTFSADDVVYTISVASNADSRVSTPANYNWIEKAEKTGDLSVRIKLKRANPAALEYFALVLPIYPKAYREKVGADAYSKAPVGSGPYKITKVEPGVSLEMERFDDYWAGSPKGKPGIKKLSIRFTTAVAADGTLPSQSAPRFSAIAASSGTTYWNTISRLYAIVKDYINPQTFKILTHMLKHSGVTGMGTPRRASRWRRGRASRR